MSMEFVMGNSLETLPKTIDFNFEELKGQLAESLALYTGLVVTEDGIKGAKEDRAKLNKLREDMGTALIIITHSASAWPRTPTSRPR